MSCALGSAGSAPVRPIPANAPSSRTPGKDKAFAEALVDNLQGRGINVWIDHRCIPPTAEWMAEIEDGIRRSDNVVSSDGRITPVPDPDDDFEARLAVLEREVARLREQTALTSSEATAARVDAAAARVLAAGADHDVSEVRAELRAHLQALNALRETQLDHAREMREGFAEIRAEMYEGFAEMRVEMREGFAVQATGMAQITALLTTIAEPASLN